MPADARPLTAEERASHALNRLAFGPRPADAAAIQAQGPKRWLADFIATQLAPIIRRKFCMPKP